MKNICVLALTILLCGCTLDSLLLKDYDINNKSSVTVSFNMPEYGDDIYTLDAGTSMTKNMYSDPVIKFTNNPRVSKKYNTGSLDFNDLTSYTCTLYNPNTQTITVSEKNDLAGSSGETFTLATEETKTIKVYTKTPDFTAVFASNNSSATVSYKM